MHGSEAYYVIGEGLLSEANENGAGPAAPVAMAATAAAPPFRFSRMAPKGTQLGDPARKKLALAMTEGGGGFGQVPAGFTYFGQFVDHDLTFDKTTVSFGANVSAADLIQGRSPALDLASPSAKGPTPPGSAKSTRTTATSRWARPRPPPASRPSRASTCRATARRSSPTSATTRTSPSRRPTSPST